MRDTSGLPCGCDPMHKNGKGHVCQRHEAIADALHAAEINVRTLTTHTVPELSTNPDTFPPAGVYVRLEDVLDALRHTRA